MFSFLSITYRAFSPFADYKLCIRTFLFNTGILDGAMHFTCKGGTTIYFIDIKKFDSKCNKTSLTRFDGKVH